MSCAILEKIVGQKLTAYIGNAQDVGAVDWWIAGGELSCDAETRLRFAFQLAHSLGRNDPTVAVQAWFTGVNPQLGGRVPVQLLREGDIETVGAVLLAAARSSR